MINSFFLTENLLLIQHMAFTILAGDVDEEPQDLVLVGYGFTRFSAEKLICDRAFA